MMYIKFFIVLNNHYIDGLEEIKRLSRKPISYKITKEQVKYAIQKLKENEQITMELVEVNLNPRLCLRIT